MTMINSVRHIVCCLIPPLVASAACSSGTTASPGTFELAVVIEGPGRLISDPVLVDCVGPKDCGTVNVPSGSIELQAGGVSTTPVGVSWTLDGVDKGRQATFLDIAGAAGERHVAKVTVTPIGGGGGGTSSDAGATDGGGDGGRPTALTCYGRSCAAGEVCCADFMKQKTFCATSCGAQRGEYLMGCQQPTDCAGGQACVPLGEPPAYACASAPTTAQNQLCDPAHPCPGRNPCVATVPSASLSTCAVPGVK